jgi:hypothetical protein
MQNHALQAVVWLFNAFVHKWIGCKTRDICVKHTRWQTYLLTASEQKRDGLAGVFDLSTLLLESETEPETDFAFLPHLEGIKMCNQSVNQLVRHTGKKKDNSTYFVISASSCSAALGADFLSLNPARKS